jgi:GalNAc-alpha-(1->4)-GalNAc-alpha-(1->3)-diNAcBac-PP-undecaprenol alpha-1,4-N-acetyl-D-galactosaminyltransferase
MRIKKINFLIPSLGTGGAERVITILANYFCNQDYVVQIFTYSRSTASSYYIDDRVQLIHLVSSKSKVVRFIKSVIFLAIDKQQNKIPVISFLPTPNLVNIVSGVLVLKIGLTIVSLRNNYRFYSAFDRLMIKYFYHYSRAIVSPSARMASDLEGVISRNGRIFGIRNPSLFSAHEIRSKRRDRWKLRFSLISRLEHHKRVTEVCETFSRKSLGDVVLRICGEGSIQDELLSRFSKHKNIEFLGRIDHIHEVLSETDYLIHSSKYEGYPNAVLESVLSGVKVVSFADCDYGVDEIVINENFGWILDDLTDLLAFIEYLKEIKPERISKKNVQYCAALHDINAIGSEWESLISG